MRKIWRILAIVATTIAVIAFFVYWAGPVGLSIWTAWKAPSRASLTPVNLKDSSISQGPGNRLSYFGYEFEVPWNDIDGEGKLTPNRVLLTFRSGLQITATAFPAKEFVNGVASSFFGMSPQDFEAKFGYEVTRSDYEFLNRLYEFTPKKMNYWALSSSVHYRECLLLMIKSTSLLPWAADSGIFTIRNQSYAGFQQGNPQARPTGFVVDLYSDEGGIEFILNQKDYQNPAGVSQAEINRLIQSLHKIQGGAPVAGLRQK